ncbi:hypothetical protein ACFOY8_12355 [Thalassospira xianhensis]|uniref:Uncharacterized protein n=1 Tax=Thalassospira xianhensis MCCC 1A02616 TaxID=1177929 RepID=A0A367UGA3_9PROT|nr:hypothetical protein [Thalassospira xianhensis]RCK06344.1 hypothetical protein TH5_09085 [Thalassospira xianhensis MCCC 1A02616]
MPSHNASDTDEKIVQPGSWFERIRRIRMNDLQNKIAEKMTQMSSMMLEGQLPDYAGYDIQRDALDIASLAQEMANLVTNPFWVLPPIGTIVTVNVGDASRPNDVLGVPALFGDTRPVDGTRCVIVGHNPSAPEPLVLTPLHDYQNRNGRHVVVTDEPHFSDFSYDDLVPVGKSTMEGGEVFDGYHYVKTHTRSGPAHAYQDGMLNTVMALQADGRVIVLAHGAVTVASANGERGVHCIGLAKDFEEIREAMNFTPINKATALDAEAIRRPAPRM